MGHIPLSDHALYGNTCVYLWLTTQISCPLKVLVKVFQYLSIR